MTVLELLNAYSPEGIVKAIVKEFPDQRRNKKQYLKVIETLKTLTPKQPEEEFKIIIELESLEFIKGRIKVSFHSYIKYKSSNDNYSLSFIPWAEIIQSEVDGGITGILGLATFLYELTWYGFDEKTINRKWKSLVIEAVLREDWSEDERVSEWLRDYLTTSYTRDAVQPRYNKIEVIRFRHYIGEVGSSLVVVQLINDGREEEIEIGLRNFKRYIKRSND